MKLSHDFDRRFPSTRVRSSRMASGGSRSLGIRRCIMQSRKSARSGLSCSMSSHQSKRWSLSFGILAGGSLLRIRSLALSSEALLGMTSDNHLHRMQTTTYPETSNSLDRWYLLSCMRSSVCRPRGNSLISQSHNDSYNLEYKIPQHEMIWVAGHLTVAWESL